MSAVAHPPALGGTRNGGVAARRAVTRWARRMFRREWRQQLLVVTLLTVAVAAAIGSITLVHNTDAAVNSEFGSANTVLEFDADSGKLLRCEVVTPRERYVRGVVVRGTENAVINSVIAIQRRGRAVPLTQSTTVSASVSVVG